MNYIPLHVYSGYTYLESSIRIEDIFSYAFKSNNEYACLCDLNSLTGFPHLVDVCSSSIKPIMGFSTTIPSEKGELYISIIVKNEEGYRSLCKLINNKDLINASNLKDYGKGLILIIPTVSNKFINSLFVSNDEKILSSLLFSLSKGFDECYLGVEIYSNNDKEIASRVREFAKNHNYELIAFPKVLYKTKVDAISLEILHAIKKNNKELKIEEAQGPFYFLSKKAAEQIYEQDEIENTYKICNSCSFNLYQNRSSLLEFPLTSSKKEYIYSLCKKKLNELKIDDNVHNERLEHEIDIIHQMGYIDYFLIVNDYVNYAHEKGIPIGPRGSCCGSLVAYLLNITEIDPLDYGLIFERFLNPSRITMPDIDIDIADNFRSELLSYIEKKYSTKRTTGIIAIQKIGAKQALRDIGNIYSFNSSDINNLSSLIKSSDATLDQVINESPQFRALLNDSYIKKIVNLAKQIEGLPRQSSIHPAGIILNNENIESLIPLVKDSSGKHISQYEFSFMEKQGFLKMDILGLRTLTIIDRMERKIKEKNNSFSLKNIPLNDKKTFDILNNGLSIGLFQITSEGMANAFKEVHIDKFEDIFSVLALYRPGPKDQIPLYARRKNKNEKYELVSKELSDILSPTYGIIIYQEQIMEIAQKCASLSYSEADIFRRAISKKDSTKLSKEKETFINGCINNNLSKEDAENIYNLIYKFADYGFNKSHAVEYSLILYRMAYIKANYPICYFEALLNDEMLTQEKYYSYKKELDYFSLRIVNPDINYSSSTYKSKDNCLYIPFTAIKSLPQTISLAIEQERKNGMFTSFDDFAERMSMYELTQNNYQSLIDSGAFDSINDNRSELSKNLSNVLKFIDLNNKMHLKEQGLEVFYKPVIQKVNKDELLENTKEFLSLGFRLNSYLTKKFKDYILLNNILPIDEAFKNNKKQILVIISKVKIIHTKKTNDTMAILQVFDDSSMINAVLFTKEYQKFSKEISENKVYLLNGYFKNDERNGISFIINEMKKMEE